MWGNMPPMEPTLTVSHQLKKPIPFDEVNSNPWLLDPAGNLEDYATEVLHARKLSRVWAIRDDEYLHIVLRPPAIRTFPHYFCFEVIG